MVINIKRKPSRKIASIMEKPWWEIETRVDNLYIADYTDIEETFVFMYSEKNRKKLDNTRQHKIASLRGEKWLLIVERTLCWCWV